MLILKLILHLKTNFVVEKEVFERKRARQPSSIYTNSMTRQPLHGIIRMNTGCSKCLSEKSLLKCTHISESVQEEHDNRRIMGRNIENLEPELSGEPRRKHRDRKKIWYPHDFHQNEDDRGITHFAICLKLNINIMIRSLLIWILHLNSFLN